MEYAEIDRGIRRFEGIGMEPRKVNVINTLQLIASPERQDEYHQKVPIANVANELISHWFDDSFLKEYDWFKGIFTEEEWRILNDFDNFYENRLERLPDSYEKLRDNFFGKKLWAKPIGRLTL